MAEHGTEVWASDAWRERAVAWLDERLAADGIARTGPVEQGSLRPWATLLSASTSQGTVWLKATGPDTAFEVGLYALLARVVPDHVLRPLAIDEQRGWIVLPDGGTPLGDQARGPALVAALVEVLPRYGELQRALAPHVDELLALGVSDMRPAVMLGRFDEGVAAMEDYVERLRDGYLEVFGDLGTHAELVEALELACRVGKVARALTWQRSVTALGLDAVEDRWARAPFESMVSLLDEPYLGRT